MSSNRLIRVFALVKMLVNVGYVSGVPEEMVFFQERNIKRRKPRTRRPLIEVRGESRMVDSPGQLRSSSAKQRFNMALAEEKEEEEYISNFFREMADPEERLEIYNVPDPDGKLEIYNIDFPSPSSVMSMVTQVPEITDPPVRSTSSPTTAAPSDSATTDAPTTTAPIVSPTKSPTALPTKLPTPSPTLVSTSLPTVSPTISPTKAPVNPPTLARTTASPTFVPTVSVKPSFSPSSSPSLSPTFTCNLDPDTRSAVIQELLKQFSDSNALGNSDSPQYKAQEWIIHQDTSYICPQSPTFLQRYVSAVLYYSTKGEDWIQCSAPEDFQNTDSIDAANNDCNLNAEDHNAWMTPSSECEWGGIVCNNNLQIEEIDIEENGLAGTLPSELRGLSKLRFLLLENGTMEGSIPSEIAELQFLEKIDLNYNELQGEIPTELYSLTTLNDLDLNDNQLTGTISTLIGQLTNLSLLSVEYNKMQGSIPVELGQLDLLTVATFDHNQFSGSMPEKVCQNRNINWGNLVVLSVDCLGGPGRESPPYVQCAPYEEKECCSQCQ